MGDTSDDITHPLKSLPKDARQHVTAGPYSPVLEVDARYLVVISGQVAVDLEGHVIGEDIEGQTAATLRDWARFNAVYEELMPPPLPVRTAVQAILLPGYLVEIEMWAVKAKE